MVIEGITLFKKQQEIILSILESKQRFIALCASRQFSKSTILQNILLYRSLNYKRIISLYITPTYSLAQIVMSKINSDLFDSGVIKVFNKSDNLIEFINGSVIHFRSSTNTDTIRGLSVNYLYIDESAFQSDDTWNVARPTMNVIGKQAILVSTPRGKQGFFHNVCMQGQVGDNENYKYYFGHYSENPFYSKLEVEDAKKTLPESVFRQEYEGEFLDDGGSVFGDVSKCELITHFKGYQNEAPYSIGIDLGRQDDYTVVTVLNKLNEVVEIFRMNKNEWTNIINGVNATIRKYNNATILCETNGIGDVVFELLRKSNSSIRAFTTTNESKNEIIEELILAFQTQQIKIPTQQLFLPLHSELNTYSFNYSPKTRRIIYSATQGFHDDCVMSLAIALKGKQKRGGSYSVI